MSRDLYYPYVKDEKGDLKPQEVDSALRTIFDYIYALTGEFDRTTATSRTESEDFTRIWVASGSDTTTTGGTTPSTPVSQNTHPISHNIGFSTSAYNSISWTGGTVYFADGTSQTVSSGTVAGLTALTFYYFYIDLSLGSPSAIQNTTSASTASGTNKVLVAMAQTRDTGEAGCTIVPRWGNSIKVAGQDVIVEDLASIKDLLGTIQTGAVSSYLTLNAGAYLTVTPHDSTPAYLSFNDITISAPAASITLNIAPVTTNTGNVYIGTVSKHLTNFTVYAANAQLNVQDPATSNNWALIIADYDAAYMSTFSGAQWGSTAKQAYVEAYASSSEAKVRTLINTTNMFEVNAAGITMGTGSARVTYIGGVYYDWPSSQSVGTCVLQNDGAGNLSWVTGGAGDVVGPANAVYASVSPTANEIAEFDSATGKLLGSPEKFVRWEDGFTNAIVVRTQSGETVGKYAGLNFSVTASAAPGSANTAAQILGKIEDGDPNPLKGQLQFNVNTGDSLLNAAYIASDKVLYFAAGVGDKVSIHGNNKTYGMALNNSELTLYTNYTGSSATIKVRDGAWGGSIVGSLFPNGWFPGVSTGPATVEVGVTGVSGRRGEVRVYGGDSTAYLVMTRETGSPSYTYNTIRNVGNSGDNCIMALCGGAIDTDSGETFGANIGLFGEDVGAGTLHMSFGGMGLSGAGATGVFSISKIGTEYGAFNTYAVECLKIEGPTTMDETSAVTVRPGSWVRAYGTLAGNATAYLGSSSYPWNNVYGTNFTCYTAYLAGDSSVNLGSSGTYLLNGYVTNMYSTITDSDRVTINTRLSVQGSPGSYTNAIEIYGAETIGYFGNSAATCGLEMGSSNRAGILWLRAKTNATAKASVVILEDSSGNAYRLWFNTSGRFCTDASEPSLSGSHTHDETGTTTEAGGATELLWGQTY